MYEAIIQGKFVAGQPRLPVVQSFTAAPSPQLNAVQLHQQAVAAHQAALPTRSSRNLPNANTLQQQPARVSKAAPLPNIPGRTVVQPRSASQPAPQQTIQRTANAQAFQLPANLSNFAGLVGQPLPEPVRQKMESFFNTSFTDVRVHVGAQASSIGALAFTHGSNLYFAPGQYNPHTVQGQQLLGHELTHVLQQRAGRVRNPFGSGVAVVQDSAMEAEADRNGMRASAHRLPVQPKAASRAGVAQRRMHVAHMAVGHFSGGSAVSSYFNRVGVVAAIQPAFCGSGFCDWLGSLFSGSNGNGSGGGPYTEVDREDEERVRPKKKPTITVSEKEMSELLPYGYTVFPGGFTSCVMVIYHLEDGFVAWHAKSASGRSIRGPSDSVLAIDMVLDDSYGGGYELGQKEYDDIAEALFERYKCRVRIHGYRGTPVIEVTKSDISCGVETKVYKQLNR